MENPIGNPSSVEGHSSSQPLSVPFQKASVTKIAEEQRASNFDRPQIALNPTPPFTQYEHMEGSPYAMKYFGIEGLQLGLNPELDGLKDSALQLEQWARAEIKNRGLEDSTQVFEFLVTEVREKLGLTQYTNKLTQLEKISEFIRGQKKTIDNRDKLKKMGEQLKADLAAETTKQQIIAKAKVTRATKPLLAEIARLQQLNKDQKKLLRAK